MPAESITEPVPGIAMSASYTVQVCSQDGRLLSEYDLSRELCEGDNLATAERRALTKLSGFRGEHLVVVVSEQTVDKFRQVQLKVDLPGDA